MRYEEIKQLIDLFEETDLAEMELTRENDGLRLVRGNAGRTVSQPAAVAQPVQQSVQPVQSAAPQQLPVKTTAESPQSILNNTDKMAQFTELMTEIVGKALAANNEELGQSISEEVGKQVIKEMNYLMREREEAEEDRFRRLDAAIRGNIRKKDEQKEKKLWKKKKPSQA